MDRGNGMRVRNEEQFRNRKIELMEKCYECFAIHGLNNAGIRSLGNYCGINSAVLYTYFDNLDDLIIS